jgi:hypothetical protein
MGPGGAAIEKPRAIPLRSTSRASGNETLAASATP